MKQKNKSSQNKKRGEVMKFLKKIQKNKDILIALSLVFFGGAFVFQRAFRELKIRLSQIFAGSMVEKCNKDYGEIINNECVICHRRFRALGNVRRRCFVKKLPRL